MSDDSGGWGKVALFFGLGCGAIAILPCVFAMVGLVALGSGPEGGVQYGSSLDAHSRRTIERRGFLQPGEEVVVYYDSTLTQSGDDVSLLTDQRLVRVREGHETVIRSPRSTRC